MELVLTFILLFMSFAVILLSGMSVMTVCAIAYHWSMAIKKGDGLLILNGNVEPFYVRWSEVNFEWLSLRLDNIESLKIEAADELLLSAGWSLWVELVFETGVSCS